MLGLFATALSVSLLGPILPPRPLSVAPPERPPIPSPQSTTDDPIEQAISAWSADPPDYVRVRQLLEPIADNEPLEDDRLRRETVLLYLADATVLDTTIMPEERRRKKAAEHLNRLLDADASFQFPSDFYSEALDALWSAVREERSARKALECEGLRLSCDADLKVSEADLATLQQKHADLKVQYGEQEVQTLEIQERTRALAIFPLGISHFYNRKWGWGGGFLAAEAAFGIAGLTLLIYRTTVDGCTREDGFRPGSLQCDPQSDSTSENAVVARRKWEEAMAWAFLGTAVLDVVMAQVLFDPTTVVNRGFQKRKDIKNAPAPEQDSKRRERKRRKDRTAQVRATVRPTPAVVRRGAGLGFRFRF